MGLPIETFSEKASVVYSILADDVPLDRSGVVYNDALNVKGETQNKRYRYSVRMFNTAGQASISRPMRRSSLSSTWLCPPPV